MPTTSPVDAWIAGLPKAELHVHLVGSASVPTVLELARRHPDAGVPTDEAALARRSTSSPTSRTSSRSTSRSTRWSARATDIEALVGGVAADMAAQQVRYAEVTATPDSHLLVGIPAEDVAAALAPRDRALAEHGVELAWIFDIPGELGLASGLRTIDWVERYAPEGSVGFGLGGPEIGVPRPQFAEVFARARALGLASVPHAGETTGPETVWAALRHLGAERIGHGIAAAAGPRAGGPPGRARGSRSRSARPRTSAPERSPRSRSTRAGAARRRACR